MHSFKKGNTVTIINQTMSGRFILEGEAVILSSINDTNERYTVKFGRGRYSDTVDRFVDPAAQADPAAFVSRLNGAAA